jgi:tRNA-specific 2-thiouridylase
MPIRKRVLVAMSGGVDSSVSAMLLKNAGYDVVGATMKLWDIEDEFNEKTCCSLIDIEYARKVAHMLKIPYYVFNFKEYFKKYVLANFVREYLSGRTPNPCIICNHKLKFDYLIRRALALDCEYIATGHYAKISKINNALYICKGSDHKKDQSYFLFSTPKDKLDKILFPLGELTKEDTRKLARINKLAVSEKKESQDLCFVTNNNYKSFIKNYSNIEEQTKGKILNSKGEILGYHNGIYNFTVGQRRGIKIAYKEPLYVKHIDYAKNTITVGIEDEILEDNFLIKNCNWFIDQKKFSGKIQIRYRGEPVTGCVAILENNTASIKLYKKLKAITPGQACVVYDDNKLLGGGWIE